MNNPSTETQILEFLNEMSEEQQQQVLDFARLLITKQPVGVSGKELLQFTGVISVEDTQLMLKAIESDCSRIDSSEW